MAGGIWLAPGLIVQDRSVEGDKSEQEGGQSPTLPFVSLINSSRGFPSNPPGGEKSRFNPTLYACRHVDKHTKACADAAPNTLYSSTCPCADLPLLLVKSFINKECARAHSYTYTSKEWVQGCWRGSMDGKGGYWCPMVRHFKEWC